MKKRFVFLKFVLGEKLFQKLDTTPYTWFKNAIKNEIQMKDAYIKMNEIKTKPISDITFYF